MEVVFFFNATATTELYTLPLHDALPISFSPLLLSFSPSLLSLFILPSIALHLSLCFSLCFSLSPHPFRLEAAGLPNSRLDLRSARQIDLIDPGRGTMKREGRGGARAERLITESCPNWPSGHERKYLPDQLALSLSPSLTFCNTQWHIWLRRSSRVKEHGKECVYVRAREMKTISIDVFGRSVKWILQWAAHYLAHPGTPFSLFYS